MPQPLLPPEPQRVRRGRPPRRRRVRGRLAATLAAVGIAGVAVWLVVGAVVSGGPGARPLASDPSAAAAVPTPPSRPPAYLAELRRDALAVERTARRMTFVSIAGRQHREVALTFDDGPGPYTLRVVRTLERLHAPATFFQVGFMLHYFSDAARAEAARPDLFAIGDHTRTHPFMAGLPAAAQAGQIDDELALARHYGVHHDRLFRPPYESFNATTLRLLRQRHMLMVLWTVDSDDYRQPGVKAIVHNVLSAVRPGAIVLMHDAGGTRTETIAALPHIIRSLRRRHFRLVTVPRLLADAPPSAHAQPRPAPGVG